MRLQVLLLSFSALALVGIVKGQGAAGKKVEIIRYPVPGAPDTIGEVDTKEAKRVLDDFYQSNVMAQEYQATMTNDASLFDRLIADRQVTNDERFGKGEVLTKAEALADRRSGRHQMKTLQHDHVRIVAFGENTVVLTGRSNSILTHDGKPSNGSRVVTTIWVKLDGRWQRIVHAMSDTDGMEARAKL